MDDSSLGFGSQPDRKRLVEECRRLQSLNLNPIPLLLITEEGGKRPFLKRGELKEDLFYRRSNEHDIGKWMARSKSSVERRLDWRWENLGVVTGSTSGIFVIDVDDEDTWPHLNNLGVYEDANTWKWNTGRGLQIAYKIPEGVEVTNFHGNNKLLPDVGFDIKGENGLAAVPPSVHYNGRQYEYVENCCPWNCALADSPENLIVAIKYANSLKQALVDPYGINNGYCGTLSPDIRRLLEERWLPARRHERSRLRGEVTATIGTLPSEDIKEQFGEVKKLFLRHDLPMSPIKKGSRNSTLLSHFRKIVRNEDISPENLGKYIQMANATLLYDKEGNELEGLEERELMAIFETVNKDLPDKSPVEVQEALTKIRQFISDISPTLKRPMDTDAKVILAFVKHGVKYGEFAEDGRLRIEMSKNIIKQESRIKNDKTLDKSLERMKNKKGLESYRNSVRETNRYLLDLPVIMDSSFWRKAEERKDHPKGGVSDNKNFNSIPKTLIPPLGIKKVFFVNEWDEIVPAVLHTTYHGGVGQAQIRQIMAFLKLGGVERKSVHTQELADELRVKRGSIYGTLKKLRKARIVEFVPLPGHYGLTEDFMRRLFELREEKGEFENDDLLRRRTREERESRRYEDELFVALLAGKNPEDIKVPEGMPAKRILKARGRAQASIEKNVYRKKTDQWERKRKGYQKIEECIESINETRARKERLG